MHITLLWISHCWNCNERIWVLKTWEISKCQFCGNIRIRHMQEQYLNHTIGKECILCVKLKK
jgi:ribosomal protein L32